VVLGVAGVHVAVAAGLCADAYLFGHRLWHVLNDLDGDLVADLLRNLGPMSSFFISPKIWQKLKTLLLYAKT
jgi:hypothetical protein